MPYANLPLTPADWTALGFYVLVWLAYEPLLKRIGRSQNAINTDMTVIRMGWMKNMVTRDNRLMDGQLVGQVLNSNSFFASSNLILIAAATGALFNGDQSLQLASGIEVIQTHNSELFQFQIGLVVIALARGLLSFIWSIRQLNYCLAAIGAAPVGGDPTHASDYAAAVARLLNPALSSFNGGVRGYYFAMAAAAWLAGPLPFLFATMGAVGLLYWRQRGSRTSKAVAQIRGLLEAEDARKNSLP